ncbi:hypothetical protein Sjap_007433 [Stephania japonica]|uniref:RING-type E3 ubiquitin transferase n=1 Tax=Stephania japonica TaxID=461633 RepID=A0AAP0PBB5_9MAGN
MDDTTTSPRAATRYTSESYALSGKIMLSAIVILFTVVLLILCLHVYARCFLSRRRHRHRHRHHNHRRGARIIFAADLSPAATSRGLDPSVLSSLPTFPFSSAPASASASAGLDCAVCLSDFAPSDTARLLPKCGHTFHVDCIDMWFHSHDTCPLCRLPVRPLGAASDFHHLDHPSVVEIVIHGAATAQPTTTLTNNINNDDDDGDAPPSPPPPPSSSRRGTMSIEVPPRRNESFKIDEVNGSPGNLRTPGGRILSFKRILGMERKGPSSTPPFSCTSAATELIDEEDQKRHCSSDCSSHQP